MNEEAVHHQAKIKHGHQPSRGKVRFPLRCSRFSCTNQLIRARIWWALRDPGGLGRHGIKSSKQLIGTLFTWKREGSLMAMQQQGLLRPIPDPFQRSGKEACLYILSPFSSRSVHQCSCRAREKSKSEMVLNK